MTWLAILGTAAAICTTGAFVPQLIKIRRQGGEDLSYVMLGIYLAGVLLWLSYGLLLHAQAVIWANTTATILVMASIILKAIHPQSRDAQSTEHPAISGVPDLVPVTATHAPHAPNATNTNPSAHMQKSTPSSTIDRFVSHAQPTGASANANSENSALDRHRTRRRPRIAVDMDEVIADAFGKMLRAYNQRTGSNITAEDIAKRGIDGTFTTALTPELKAELDRMCHQDDFFADLELVAGSQAALRELSEYYEIFIASAAMDVPSSFDAKFKWLQQHFSFIPPSHYVFCGDKSILLADFLIDDRPRHFDHFVGTGILFTAPHNARREAPLRANNWQDVTRILMSALDENSGALKPSYHAGRA